MVYRDCAGINVDASTNLQLSSPCGNRSLTVSHSGATEISQLCDQQLPNSTCNNGALPGIQQYIYTGTIILPPCNSWSIRWTNIYRNNAIVNLMNPGTQEMFIEAVLNNAAAPCNDSPVFTNTAIPYVCLGYPVSFSYGAFDPEADSLSYTLIGARRVNGNAIPYVAPNSPAAPIPGLVLDPATGLISFTLNTAGNWVVVVRVTQYNAAGQVIGTIMRDMQFVAYPCDNIPPDAATGLVDNLTGNATQTGPRSVEVCESGDFCFDMEISDVNVTNVLTAFSNIQQNLPGATFTYTGTNPITAQVCWTALPNSAGFFPFIVNVNDGACPIPAIQTYVYSVLVRPGVTATIEAEDESCLGSGNGTLTAVISAGTSPYSYTWSNGGSEESITDVPGDYEVTIEDSYGCVSHVLSGTIGTAAYPNEAIAGGDFLACMDQLPLQLSGSVVSATEGTWSGGSGDMVGTGLAVEYMPTAEEILFGSVQFTLTTTNNEGCPPASDDVIVSLANSFSDADITSVDATCYGSENGEASFTPADPGFTYIWDDPLAQSTATAIGLGAGTYNVLVTDEHGCTITLPAFIGPNEPLSILDVETTDESCLGLGDGSATVNATGGTSPYTYEWSNGSSGQTLEATAGDYTVSIVDANGCAPAVADVTIAAAALPNEADAGGDQVICMDALPIPLSGTVVNATGGSWSGGSGDFTGTGLNVHYMPAPEEIDLGEVTLSLSTLGNTACPPAADDITILIANSFADGTVEATDATCFDVNNGSASFTPTMPQFTYAWDDILAQTTATATGLGAGTVNVTVTDEYGCSITLPALIGPPGPITIVELTSTEEACLGSGNGTATVSVAGGTEPYVYSWSNGSTEASITETSGTYTVSITDANGCTPATGEVTIGAAALPNVADAGADLVFCTDAQNIQLSGMVTNASGGAWSGGNGTFTGSGTNVQYTVSTADVAAGNVTLTLTTTGNDGCPPAIDEVNILIPNSFVDGAIATVDATCYEVSNGMATYAPANAGLSYTWNDAQSQTTATATDLGAGEYLLTVSDTFGCSIILPAFIGPASPITIAELISEDENCLGSGDGNASVEVVGGTAPYTYAWSNGGDQASIIGPSGDYTVLISDANGCAPTVGTITIGSTGLPNQADAGSDIIVCMNTYPVQLQGAVVNATSGSWTGGNGALDGNGLMAEYWPTIGEIIAGSVDLVFTTVGNETCPAVSDTVHLVLANAFINASVTAANASCNGLEDGTLTFAPSDPSFSYAWNIPGASGGPMASGLAAGTYSVTVTDALGCDSTFTGTVTEPESLVIAEVNTVDVTCNGGANGQATVAITGGTLPYAVSWSTGAAGMEQNNLIAGQHTATATDANGCTTAATASIGQPEPIVLQALIPDTVCVNAPVLLTAQAEGGHGNYQYTWTGLGTGDSLMVEFPASQYVFLTVTDSAGCTAPSLIEQVFVLDISLADLDAYGGTTVCAGQEVTIGATVSGYPGGYAISWPSLPATGAGPFTFPLTASMQVPVTLSNSCGDTQNETISLVVDVLPAVQVPLIIAEGCAPLTVQFPSQQFGNASWTWDLGNGQTTSASAPIVVYQAGTYTATLTVTTPAGCTNSGSATGQIIAHTSPTAAFTASPYITDLENANILFTDQSIGTINTYGWSFGDGGTSGAINPQHNYTDIGNFEVSLTVQNVEGCTGTTTQIIQITPVYDITLPNAFTPSLNGGNSGGYSPYDLNNDVFYAFVRHVEDFRMRIFNRWGELIFESSDLQVGWDGYYRGELSPQDVYVVQTWIRFVDGREIQKLSDLTLLR